MSTTRSRAAPVIGQPREGIGREGIGWLIEDINLRIVYRSCLWLQDLVIMKGIEFFEEVKVQLFLKGRFFLFVQMVQVLMSSVMFDKPFVSRRKLMFIPFVSRRS